MTPEPEDLSADSPPASPGLPDDDSRGSYVRNTAIMSIGTALSRFTGFLRSMAAAAAIGVTLLSDAYNRANTLPFMLYELLLGGILTSVFVPLFVDWRRKHGEREAWHVGDRVITLTAVSLTALTLLVIVAAPWIVGLYNSLVQGPERAQADMVGVFFLRWLMPQIIFEGIAAVAGGLLTANRRFAPPMFAPILNNVAVIVTFAIYAWVLHGGTDIAAITTAQKVVLGAGTTLGSIAMMVALFPALRGLGYHWRPRFDWLHPAMRRLARLAGWVLLYVVANQIAFMLVLIFSGRVDGGVTAYAYAFLVFSLPHAIFVVSIFTAILPGMASRWSARDPAGVRELFSRGARDSAVIMIPASLGYFALAIPISALLFEHGNVGQDGTALIAHTLQAFVIGLPFFSTFQLLTRTFYALQDTRTPALVNLAAAVVNIGADLLFMFVLDWGIPGLALGHAVSYVFATAVCLVILHGRLEGVDGRRIVRTITRTVPVAIAAAAAAYAVTLPFAGGTTGSNAIQVGLGILVGGGTFLLLSLIVRIDEVDEVRAMVLRRFRG